MARDRRIPRATRDGSAVTLGSMSRIERDRALAEIGARQHGTISRRQALAIGFSPSAIGRMLAAGRLREVHAGVYAIGPHELSAVGYQFAALLAIGPDPLLSHQTSASKQDLVRASSIVHVSISTRVQRRLAGVVVHRPRRIDPEDRVRIDGLPMTGLPRTLLDLAEVLRIGQLESAIEAADRSGRLDVVAIQGVVERYRGHRGCRPLKRIIGPFVSTPDANEGLERKFQLLLAEFGLPLPQLNVLVEGLVVDCWWPEARLVIELDSQGWHKTWQAHERDRKRDAILLRAGIRCLRITHHRLQQERLEVAHDVSAALAIPAPGASQARYAG